MAPRELIQGYIPFHSMEGFKIGMEIVVPVKALLGLQLRASGFAAR